jgi:hypothetical protein
MTRYKVEDTIVDTDNAAQSWIEREDYHRGRITGELRLREKLYRSRRGRFFLEHISTDGDGKPWAEWIDTRRAIVWLILNGWDIPTDLIPHVEHTLETTLFTEMANRCPRFRAIGYDRSLTTYRALIEVMREGT